MRREDGEPWTLCRLPIGGGRHPTANVPGDFAAHRGTTATATTSAGVRRSMVMHSIAIDGRSAYQCQGIWPDQALDHRSGYPGDGSRSHLPSVLQDGRKGANTHAISRVIWGIPADELRNPF